MKILYVHGFDMNLSSEDIIQALKAIGYEVQIFENKAMPVTVLQDESVQGLTECIRENKIDLVFSLYFIMSAGLAAYQTNIRYAAILWDAPYTEIYNPIGRLENVWISTFDKIDRDRMLAAGMKHVFYQPLSVNPHSLKEWNNEIQDTLQGQYMHDISFIGKLYETNLYDEHIDRIPAEVQPYFQSIFEEAAFKWDGVNRVYGQTGEEIIRYMQMINPDFKIPNKQDIEDSRYFEINYLIRKIANIERIVVLNMLAENHDITFYTDSASAKTRLQNVTLGPPVKYGKATALVYAGSKINLNISLKGIEGGAPLRILDIMGAGGFVLSSYCAEMAQIFEEDKEIVMFKTPEELLEKVDFYLAHDKEREQIARAGHEKVINCYTYEKNLRQFIDWIERES